MPVPATPRRPAGTDLAGGLMSGHAVPRQVSTVFLLQGTNARGAPWTRQIPAGQRDRHGPSGVRIVPSDWSGDNSHRARVLAGRQLASRIQQVAEKSPESNNKRAALVGASSKRPC
jgi:hypothetical protein